MSERNWAVYETALYLATPPPDDPPTPPPPTTHTHPQMHTWMQMCLLAMKKLSALICSLRPEDKSDHGDGGRPLPSPPLLPPPISPARGSWAQVALEGGPPFSRAGCRCCSPSGSVSPKRPWCQEDRQITAGVTLKPTERENAWLHGSCIPARQEVDTLKCIVYSSAPHWCHVDGIYSATHDWYGSRVDLQRSADINVNKADVRRGALISSAYGGGFKAARRRQQQLQ